MMVTIFRCWRQKTYVAEIFMHVGDIPIGDQHHNMPECGVGDEIWMLVTSHITSIESEAPTSNISHHLFDNMNVTNMHKNFSNIRFLSPTSKNGHHH